MGYVTCISLACTGGLQAYRLLRTAAGIFEFVRDHCATFLINAISSPDCNLQVPSWLLSCASLSSVDSLVKSNTHWKFTLQRPATPALSLKLPYGADCPGIRSVVRRRSPVPDGAASHPEGQRSLPHSITGGRCCGRL